MEFINDALREYQISGRIGKTFTLPNGEDSLGKHFSVVEKLTREDGLAITHIPDFVMMRSIFPANASSIMSLNCSRFLVLVPVMPLSAYTFTNDQSGLD